jgi:protoheme IX farnesyltransferase
LSQTLSKTRNSKLGLALDLNSFFNLMKPRVMSLVLFTCMVGLLIAPYSVDLKTSLISLLAVAIGSGAAGALNMWYESDVDALMSRTLFKTNTNRKSKKKSGFIFWNYFIIRIYCNALLFCKSYFSNIISINN